MNIKEIPFSSFGSFWTISPLFQGEKKDRLYLRNVRGGDFHDHYGVVFELLPKDLDLNPLDYTLTMKPHELILTTKVGFLRFCICEDSSLVIFGQGMALTLHRIGGRYDSFLQLEKDICRVNCSALDLRVTLSLKQGVLESHAPWLGDRCSEILLTLKPKEFFYVLLEETPRVPRSYAKQIETKDALLPYECLVEEARKKYQAWEEKTLLVPKRYEKGKALATYITYSAVVSKGNHLTRTAMYMSKNWMTNIWSWDNCFNALALAKHNPELAYDQLLAVFDHQDETGMLPDFLNDKMVYYGFTKPPIYGVIWSMLERENPAFFRDKTEEIYPLLAKLTKYWLDYTDLGDGLPRYGHGNDAGWDNSTIFLQGVPLASPDLLSFLIIQMDLLAVLASRRNKEEEKRYWEDYAQKSFERFFSVFVKDNQFVLEGYKEGDSLILLMPLLLGERLAPEIRAQGVRSLTEDDRFLTPYGLATESIKSPYFKEDGYWRGPMWAPAVLLFFEGLLRCGYPAVAKDIALRFLDTANTAGMAENFSVLSGRGLCDRAFTWTSSVFLYLAHHVDSIERGGAHVVL